MSMPISKELAAWRAEVERLERELAAIMHPFHMKIARLQKQMEVAVAVTRAELEKARTGANNCQDADRKAHQQHMVQTYRENCPRSFEEFKEFSRLLRELFPGYEALQYFECHADEEFRAPMLDGYALWAAREGTYAGATKIYAAWSKEPGTPLVGVLAIKPSRHRGDYTEAVGLVDGKEVFKSPYSIQRPLDTWLTALKNRTGNKVLAEAVKQEAEQIYKLKLGKAQ